jgi:hypothetical protein
LLFDKPADARELIVRIRRSAEMDHHHGHGTRWRLHGRSSRECSQNRVRVEIVAIVAGAHR